MAITSLDLSCDKFPTKSACSANSSKGGNSCRLLKLNFAPDSSLSSTHTLKGGKTKNNNTKSPYLTTDRVQLLSRVTEKRLAVHKKTTDFVSSFPLAVNLYKANSDEFKSSKKGNKKVKKSVLTLPNAPVPVPQCTVSDMNDSEYCGQIDEDRKQKVIKKRIPIQSNRKARVREKDFEFYDRDAQYCSQLNINLDSSSTDLMKNFNGDGKRISNKKKNASNFNKPQPVNNDLSDVWTVLRNINRFQFRPSPPMSEESITPIKKTIQKRRTNRKDTRVIETCRTEEFAYISRFEMDDKTPRTYSQSSSIDRVTVIDKQNEFSKICEEFEKRLLKTHNYLKDTNNTKNRTQKHKYQSRNTKNSMKALGNVAKEGKHLGPMKKKKKSPKSADYKSKSESTRSNTVTKDSGVDEGNSQITDTCDVSSHLTQNESLYPSAGSFVYSDNSGSSKAEAEQFLGKIGATKGGTQMSNDVCHSQLNDTIKEGLIKGTDLNMNSIVNKMLDPQKRKPRLVTTMPSSCMMPKLTQTEIKRRLAHIRFPVLILGKDQFSSIPVPNYDPPQFEGLDEHIWPFMTEWCNNPPVKKPVKESKRNSFNRNSYNRKNTCLSNDSSSIQSNKQSIETAVNKIPMFKEKNNSNDLIKIKKGEGKRSTPISGINDKLLQCTKKQKSIVQLKEKMLNFLYKKTSNRNFVGDHQNVENDTKCKTLGTGIKVEPKNFSPIRSVVPNVIPIKIGAPSPIPAMVTNKKTPHYAYPWAKAKWASDFIENVIKKIRSGVYYTQDNKDGSRFQPDLKEVSVQAGTLCDSSDSTQTYESDIELARKEAFTSTRKNLISIPGFSNSQPVLEITTLNMNQIAVKHCVTNVMFQFDITVPSKINSPTNTSKSLPLIPIEVTKSHTKIYKCNTTILNAMLPAELCSILPRIMSNLIEVNVDSDIIPPLCPVKTESCLSTISELTRGETSDILFPIASIQKMPSRQTLVIDGRFANKISILKSKPNKLNVRVNYSHDLVTKLLPKIVIKNLSEYLTSPIYNMSVKEDMNAGVSKSKLRRTLAVPNTRSSKCSILEVYSGSNKRLRSSFKPFDLISVIESILSSRNLQINRNLTSYFDMLKLQYDGKGIKINVSMMNDIGVQRNMTVVVNNLKIDSIYEASPITITRKIEETVTYKSETRMKCIEYKQSLANKTESTEINQISSNKIKRSKGFYKQVHRKCKSTTNIPSGDKNVNTPLSKITNLEEFFQVLGSKKNFSGVFDGYAAKKILTSITEMKNWVTEINPKQALLILLLTNKKDTPNLVRFRPILLQGIAVNRITRAAELDMEIEVIERENLNKFSQYEGISYLPESATNYDNLLEELYWIAKTTASDYQKPFDESSERLLKSLLEKRKKLNPSYLRVMARYVGLGLLKPPTKT